MNAQRFPDQTPKSDRAARDDPHKFAPYWEADFSDADKWVSRGKDRLYEVLCEKLHSTDQGSVHEDVAVRSYDFVSSMRRTSKEGTPDPGTEAKVALCFCFILHVLLLSARSFFQLFVRCSFNVSVQNVIVSLFLVFGSSPLGSRASERATDTFEAGRRGF